MLAVANGANLGNLRKLDGSTYSHQMHHPCTQWACYSFNNMAWLIFLTPKLITPTQSRGDWAACSVFQAARSNRSHHQEKHEAQLRLIVR